MRVVSREYKVMADPGRFADPAAGLAAVRDEVAALARAVGVGFEGEFNPAPAKDRVVLFLDTPDATLRLNGLLLRRRAKPGGEAMYTLKARTEDRYLAAAADLRPGPDLSAESKFEEDIGVPFVSRFSHSADVGRADDGPPATLGAAGLLFPGLLGLRRDGLPCPAATPLAPVNGREVTERVFKGPVLRLDPDDPTAEVGAAAVAVIVWAAPAGRLVAAEVSFRYGDPDENYPPAVAAAARRLFARLQQADWASPDARTKTELMYGG